VRLFVGGRPVIVTIDDKVPYKNSSQLMFSECSPDGASWIPLIEKAYAKVAGHYEKIGLGWMQEALKILTGAPSHRFATADMNMEELWSLMVSADKNRYPMTLATQSGRHGLITAHAYTLVSLHHLKDSEGQIVERLVQLHNPWANEYYTGPWSDNDSRWTDFYKS
jgi:hypothetical protein